MVKRTTIIILSKDFYHLCLTYNIYPPVIWRTFCQQFRFWWATSPPYILNTIHYSRINSPQLSAPAVLVCNYTCFGKNCKAKFQANQKPVLIGVIRGKKKILRLRSERRLGNPVLMYFCEIFLKLQ